VLDGQDARRSAAFAVFAAALSRAAVFLAGFYWVSSKPVVHHAVLIRDPRYAEALHGLAGKLIDPWANWDGVWFVRIASSGYGHPHSPAFFPLYPLLMRALSVVTGGNLVVAGIVISLVAYAVAMVLLFKLVRPLFGPQVAAWSVAFISWFPTSVYFSAVYSESLFLMLVLGSMFCAFRQRWALAGAAAFFAALTRNTGVLLVIPLALLYGREHAWSWRRVRLEWPRDLRLGWLLLAPAGLLAYMGYLWSRFGNPMAFNTAEAHWHRHLSDPLSTVVDGVATALRETEPLHAFARSLVYWLQPGHVGQVQIVYYVAPLLALVFALLMIVLGWRRLPFAFTAWALLGVLLPLCYPTEMRPLYSLHRFVVLLFPLFIAEALATRRLAVLRWLLLAISAAVLIWYTFAFAAFAEIG